MSDVGPVIPLSSGRSFGDKTPEELEAMLDGLTPDGALPDEQQPPAEVTPEPEPEPEPQSTTTTESEPETTQEPQSEPEPELDVAASEREGDRIKMQKLEAAILLQQAHNSRLAGEIGYLRNQRSQPVSEPYEPQSQQEVDRLQLLEQRFAEAEARRNSFEVSQAVADAIGTMDGPWVNELSAEVQEIAPKYKDQIEAANNATDPEMARQLAMGIAMLVKAEAMEKRWDAKHATLVEKKASSRAENDKAKKAAAPSASGAVPAPPPKAKTIADMTPKEADEWLQANVR
jgi:hypothetical protein